MFSSSYRHANPLMLKVARTCSTPQNVLASLAAEDDPELLVQIAQNVNTPISTLSILAQHDSARVRAALTANPVTPFNLIWILKDDRHFDVRFALASNAETFPDVLDSLCHDEEPRIAERARQSLGNCRFRPEDTLIEMPALRQYLWSDHEAV